LVGETGFEPVTPCV